MISRGIANDVLRKPDGKHNLRLQTQSQSTNTISDYKHNHRLQTQSQTTKR